MLRGVLTRSCQPCDVKGLASSRTRGGKACGSQKWAWMRALTSLVSKPYFTPPDFPLIHHHPPHHRDGTTKWSHLIVPYCMHARVPANPNVRGEGGAGACLARARQLP